MNVTKIQHVVRLVIIWISIICFSVQYFPQGQLWILTIIASGLIVIYWGMSSQLISTSMVTLGFIITGMGLSLLGQSNIEGWEVWGLWIIYPLTIKYANQKQLFTISLGKFLTQERSFPFSAVLRLLILCLIGIYHQRAQNKKPQIQPCAFGLMTPQNPTLE